MAGLKTVMHTYASTRSDDVLIYTSPVLTAGQHTVKVRVTGTKKYRLFIRYYYYGR